MGVGRGQGKVVENSDSERFWKVIGEERPRHANHKTTSNNVAKGRVEKMGSRHQHMHSPDTHVLTPFLLLAREAGSEDVRLGLTILVFTISPNMPFQGKPDGKIWS